jgi:predicted permease
MWTPRKTTELFPLNFVSSDTKLLEDTIRDILFALRTFRRAPLVAFTIVATVALGLGLVAVAFTILNLLLFRVDQVPRLSEIFAVERRQNAAGLPFTRAEFDALRRETTVFTDAYAQVGDVYKLVDGRATFGTFITGNAFEVLAVRAAIGRTLTPADDGPSAERPVMVLSHRGWDRLFARDPAVVGRRLLLNDIAVEIIGVMPDGFRGLNAVAPDDYWAPMSMLSQVRPVNRGPDGKVAFDGVDIVGRLRPGLSPQAAEAQLAVWWDAGHPGRSAIERSAQTMTLVPRRGVVEQPREAVLMTAPLFFAFGLILLIGCANVGNLLLARAVARQREIGIRLSLGATRRRLVRQLLTESLLLALVAAAGGLAISRVVLRAIIDALTNANLGDIRLLLPATDWRVLLFLLVAAAVSTTMFALGPALHATRIDPIRTMRGEIVRDARPGRARNILIGLQVSASALLLVCAAVFLRSAFEAATFDPGMRISDTVLVQITSEPARNAMVQAVTTEPSVAAVAASWPAAAGVPRTALAETDGAKATVAYRFVSPEYLSVLDIAIVQGRPFAPAERTPDASVAIVSETTAQALWPNASAIGRVVRLDPDPSASARTPDDVPFKPRTLTVVGVVRDVAGFRMAPFPKAVVYMPTSTAMPNTALVARVRGNPEQARQVLLNRLATIDSTIDPNMRGGEGQVVGTMQWITRLETQLLQLAFRFTIALGVLALALTLSGLFSVLSYVVEQRNREIGVRMALGATPLAVTRLVLSQSIRPVGVGLVIGGGLAAGLAKLLLATAGAATVGHIVHVLDPLAYGVSLLIIIAACLVAASIPAMRAARLNPARTLRQQ